MDWINMSHVRCIFSASKDMTINIKLFPIYSNSYGHAYDAMFAHDIAATFPSDRVRVCVANFVDRARCLHAHVRHEYIYRALILQYIYIYIYISNSYVLLLKKFNYMHLLKTLITCACTYRFEPPLSPMLLRASSVADP